MEFFCTPITNEGVGLRSPIALNEATNLKLCWDMMISDESYAIILKCRTLRRFDMIKHHIFFSVWQGIKSEYNLLTSKTSWIIGHGSSISFWTESWCGAPLILETSISFLHNKDIDPFAKISDILLNGQWHFPVTWSIQFPFIIYRVKAPDSI